MTRTQGIFRFLTRGFVRRLTQEKLTLTMSPEVKANMLALQERVGAHSTAELIATALESLEADLDAKEHQKKSGLN